MGGKKKNPQYQRGTKKGGPAFERSEFPKEKRAEIWRKKKLKKGFNQWEGEINPKQRRGSRTTRKAAKIKAFPLTWIAWKGQTKDNYKRKAREEKDFLSEDAIKGSSHYP